MSRHLYWLTVQAQPLFAAKVFSRISNPTFSSQYILQDLLHHQLQNFDSHLKNYVVRNNMMEINRRTHEAVDASPEPIPCGICSQLDFMSMFTGRTSDFYLATSAKILDNAHCAMCQLVVQTTKNVWKEDGFIIERQYRVKSESWATEESTHSISNATAADHFQMWLGYVAEDNGESYHGGIAALQLFEGCEVHSSCQQLALRDNSGGFADRKPLLSRRMLKEHASIDLIRSWLRECARKHDHENPGSITELIGRHSFKVIDVQELRLVSVCGPLRYVALSYMWGAPASSGSVEKDDGAPSTDTDSSSPVDGSLNRRDLPRTIGDAIDLVALLGERYLWVDALCIDQNDPNEKAFLIPHMNHIYECAEVTIVAAAGNGATAGLPGVAQTRRLPECSTTFRTRQGVVCLGQARPSLKNLIEESNWNTRGWTYQERLLSRRCLYFTESEAFFTCSTSEWRESYVLESHERQINYTTFPIDETPWTSFNPVRTWDIPTHVSLTGSIERSLYDYISAVETYAGRNLTVPGDKLAAFAGILNKFVPEAAEDSEKRSVHAHGLPIYYLEYTLQWQSSVPSTQRSSTEGLFPSWSWASFDGPVTYPFRNRIQRAIPGRTAAHVTLEPFQLFRFKTTGIHVLGWLFRAPGIEEGPWDTAEDLNPPPISNASAPTLTLKTFCVAVSSLEGPDDWGCYDIFCGGTHQPVAMNVTLPFGAEEEIANDAAFRLLVVGGWTSGGDANATIEGLSCLLTILRGEYAERFCTEPLYLSIYQWDQLEYCIKVVQLR